MKRLWKKALKWLLWVIGSIVLLLILLVIIIQLPPTQRFLTHKAESYLQGKLKTKVRIGEIGLAFPKSIFIGDVYVESLQHDTLLFSHSLKVDIDMLGLLDHKVIVNSIKMERFTAHVLRTGPDSSFNYSFIMKAFSDSSDKKPKKQSNSKPYQIAVHGIYLHNFYITYNDKLTGMNSLVRLGKLDIDIRKMDLDKQLIAISKIDFENTTLRLAISKESKSDTTKSSSHYDISVDNIKLAGVNASYTNTVSGQAYGGFVGNLAVLNSEMKMATQKISIKSVELAESFASVALNENGNGSKKDTTKQQPGSESGPGWNILLSHLKVDNTQVSFDNQSAKPVSQGMDFNHLGLREINVLADNISYTTNRTSLDLVQLGLQERCGFAVRTLRTKFLFDSVETVLSGLDINTGNTHISKYIGLYYTSLSQLSDDMGKVGIKADVAESIVGYRDILYFAPSLSKTAPFSKDPDGEARIAAFIDGKIGNLNLHNITATAGKGTLVQVNGHIKNLPDMDRTFFDLNIAQMHTTRQDVAYFSPPHVIPSNIHIPQRISTKGYYKGSIHDFAIYLDTKTSMGNATASLKMKMPKNTKYSTYSTDITINRLQLGELLGQEKTLGPLTMHLNIIGSGLSLPDLNEQISAHISQATAMKYPYSNIDINGNFRDEAFNGTVNVKDTNIDLNFKGIVGVNPDSSVYKFVLDVKAADLHGLGLMDSDFRFKGTFQADIVKDSSQAINGTANFTKVLILKNKKTYPVRSFAFFSAEHTRRDSLTIRSDFMNADFSGNIRPTELGPVLQAHLNRYFNIKKDTGIAPEKDQNFRFHIDIGRTDLITEVFYPKIQKLVTGPINGSYNSATRIINLDIEMPEIKYSNITIDSLKVKVNSAPSKLDYNVTLEKMNAGLLIKNIALGGRIENDSINSRFTVKDDSNKNIFMVAAGFRSQKNEIEIHVKQNGLIVSYKPWQISRDNFIEVGDEIYVHDLVMSYEKSGITINSPLAENTKSPLLVNFKNFDLAEATRWLQKDTLYAGGTLNGTVNLKNLNESPVFDANLTVENLSYKNDTLGNMQIEADNNETNRYNLNMKMTGNKNDLAVKGYYATEGTKSTFNIQAVINRFTLKSAEPFIKGQMSSLGGDMDGSLLLSGTTESPNITGKLHFKESEFTLDYLSTHYKLHDENIVFNTKNIRFDNFRISDSADNTATVNGFIYTKYFSDFKFDMKVKTDHFLALNSQPKKGAEFYGKLLATSNITIKGSVNAPIVNATAHLEKGTAMTIVIPENAPTIESRQGVVFFSDINRPQNKILYKHKFHDTVQQIEIKGVTLTSNIEVDKNAELKVIVDPEAGDYLDVKGAGTLSLGMRSDGTLTLTGRYEILEGSYQLTFYDFVKRRFTIQQGGSITWLGSPMEAELNLTAMYETRAAPYPILESELSGLSDQQRNQYYQQIRFQVLIKMTGQIKKPTLDMDITLNDLDKAAFNGAVIERLTEMELDKSEINKQVFALLVLNRLVYDNPLETQQENIVQDVAYTSASELLSQQLNNLASRFLKRGSLSFDVRTYQDYSTGSPTLTNEFKASLQESALEDRLTFNLGSQVDVQGTDKLHPQTSATNQAVSDVTIQYALTKDGRYRVLVFRDNTYAGIIQGQLVETGAGIAFVKDFNSFKHIFDPTKNQEGIVEDKKPGQTPKLPKHEQ